MKKLLKWGLIIFVILAVIGAVSSGGKPASTPASSTATKVTEVKAEVVPVQVDAKSFIAEFDKNQLAAEEKYKNKTIQFTAIIKNISEDVMGSPFYRLFLLVVDPITLALLFSVSLVPNPS
jgi:multidrug efflux pump subunit AcrA (membrane-fusion protein)